MNKLGIWALASIIFVSSITIFAFAQDVPTSSPSPPVEKELVVIGDDRFYAVGAFGYTVTVDGQIRPGNRANPADVISADGKTVNGRMHRDSIDSFFFTGSIVSITGEAHLKTTVDGIEVPNNTPPAIVLAPGEKELIVKGDDRLFPGRISYSITVDGQIRIGDVVDPGDIISADGKTVNGSMFTGHWDRYFFTGSIVSSTGKAHVVTTVDGIEVPNNSMPTIVLAPGERELYIVGDLNAKKDLITFEIIVTDQIKQGMAATVRRDVVSPDGTRVNGDIYKGNLDGFIFSGDIVSITADSSIIATVDDVAVPFTDTSLPVFVFSASENMQCKEGLVLIFKINGNEACVKPTSVEKLLQRGWASYELTAAAKISIDDDLPDTEKVSIDDDFTIPPILTGEFLTAVEPDDLTDFDTTGLLAYYNFEEASGDLINVSPSADSLGSAADMTNTGVLYEQDCIMSKCYHYNDHKSDYSQVDIDLSTLDFPVSFNGWIKKNSDDGVMHILMIGDSNTPEIFIGIQENAGTLLKVILKNPERFQSSTFDRESFFPDDGWVMVTGVIRANDDIVEVYVNGVSRQHENWSRVDFYGKYTFPANLNTMAINLMPDGTPMGGGDGFYDEISFWNRELSPSEIRKLYNGGAGLSLLPS